jgi:hypothetical protein
VVSVVRLEHEIERGERELLHVRPTLLTRGLRLAVNITNEPEARAEEREDRRRLAEEPLGPTGGRDAEDGRRKVRRVPDGVRRHDARLEGADVRVVRVRRVRGLEEHAHVLAAPRYARPVVERVRGVGHVASREGVEGSRKVISA